MLSIISDAIIPIILSSVGIIMLICPYDKIQDSFPGLKSKKAVKICGAFLLLCGVVCSILLFMNFLDM